MSIKLTFRALALRQSECLSITQLVDYCKSCILIGHATRGLLVIAIV